MRLTVVSSGTETRELTAQGNGVRLFVREWPGGEPAVLALHGLASTSHIFDLVAPQLAPERRVVAYDQRGHGLSGKPTSGYGFERTVADARAVMNATGLDHPIAFGHSWGANVALELAVRFPRILSGLVLLDGGFSSLRDRMTWREASERLAPPSLAGIPVEQFLPTVRKVMGRSVKVTTEIEGVFLSLMRVDRGGQIHPRLSRRNHMRILRAMWEQDPRTLLRMVRVPTLVLGALPRNPSMEEAPFLEAKRVAAQAVQEIGPPVRFQWIEGIHDVPLQHPEAVATHLRRFAKDVSG